MHQELIQLGSDIKHRREEKGISLREVENATSIRFAHLQAIEEGQLGKLISPVYAQGFITKYLQFLEIDSDLLLSHYPYVIKILNEKSPEIQDFTLGIGSLEVRGSPGGEIKWLPNVVWVGASVGLILAAWFVARYLGFF